MAEGKPSKEGEEATAYGVVVTVIELYVIVCFHRVVCHCVFFIELYVVCFSLSCTLYVIVLQQLSLSC